MHEKIGMCMKFVVFIEREKGRESERKREKKLNVAIKAR